MGGWIYPVYVVGDSDNVVEEIWVAVVTKPKSALDQVEDLLRRLLAGMASPTPVPAPVLEVPMVEKLLQRLVAETQIRQPAPVIPPEPVEIRKFAQIVPYLSGQQTSGQQPRQRPIRRDWNGIVCFSCGKAGHSATRCPVLDESFPFMLPGWMTETTPGGFIMISPRVAAEHRRAENGDCPGGGGGFVDQISSKTRPQDPGLGIISEIK